MSDLARDLVDAAARAIADVDGHASDVQPCGDATYPEMAREAVAATLRAFVATGGYPVDRRSILALASAVERGR